MRPDVLDEIQLLARVGWEPEDLNPVAKPTDLFHGPLRGVTGAVVQHENDLLARSTRPIGEKIEQADGLFCDGVLPEPVREQKGSIGVAKSPANSDAAVLAGRFDA